MQRRLFLTTSAAAASALAAPAVWSQSTPRLTPVKFTLDFRITGQTSPFFLAQQRGYYKDEGLDVSIDVGSGSVASITRIASGVYQMGLGDISSLIEFQASQSGTPLVQAVYQYYNRAPFAIIGARTVASPATSAVSRARRSLRPRWSPRAGPGRWWRASCA
jgi:ABC-type nitrate/sulfonate/bicarbonate transport system substrate-binding protein